jgi:hypothetical protein
MCAAEDPQGGKTVRLVPGVQRSVVPSTQHRATILRGNPPRCSRVWNEKVVEFAERFLKSPPTGWQTAPLPELPAEAPPLGQVPGSDFLRLANAFSALYPNRSEEKRLLDAMLLAVPRWGDER